MDCSEIGIMKIVIVMDNLDLSQGGGVGSFVYDLAYELAKYQENKIYLIGIVKIRNKSDIMLKSLEEQGVKIFDMGVESRKKAVFGLWRYMPRLHKILAKISINEKIICNVHLKLGVLYGALAAKGLKNVLCVETYHSLYSRYWLENRVLSSQITMYIPCSKSATDEFVKRFHPNPKKVYTIPNGVDCEKIRESVEESNINSGIVALSVGRLTRQKNFQTTTRAFSRINNKDFTYRIYGEGEEKKQIRQMITSDQVVLKQPVPRQEILNELANCSIVVMPSLWEGLSIFMLEAIALGCPMMISDVPSLRNVFDEAKLDTKEPWRRCEWGYLIKTNDVEAYYEAMTDFIGHSNLASQMHKNVEKISDQYDIQNTAHNYMKVYIKLTKA